MGSFELAEVDLGLLGRLRDKRRELLGGELRLSEFDALQYVYFGFLKVFPRRDSRKAELSRVDAYRRELST